MVFINSQKFACESCIKGHRSSSCHHTERPLFEVKKKGRPVSQCEKCRELRKTKRVHTKCDCSSFKEAEPAMRQLSVKSKRFIPILPALPNGIRDAYPQSATAVKVNPRRDVTSLLNPCHCKDVWSCKCRTNDSTVSEPARPSESHDNSGLAALANAAALCCSNDITMTSPDLTPPPTPSVPESLPNQKHTRSCCQSSPKARPQKLQRRSPTPPEAQTRGPELPPIIASPSLESSSPSGPLPVFPEIPPLSSVASLAGSGCCCGFRCTCPGCVEHRGPQHAAKDHTDCPDGCGTCVDYEGGIELPSAGSGSSSEPKTTNFIDAFFARAAASIPLPPAQRSLSISLDPTNVTVYPASLFSGQTKNLEERGAAFGLIQLPKLECCAGRCRCPEGLCGCGNACDGCCENHGGEHVSGCSSPSSAREERSVRTPAPPTNAIEPVGSCCGN